MFDYSQILWILAAVVLIVVSLMAVTAAHKRELRKRRESVEKKAQSLRYPFLPEGDAALVAELGQLMPRTHKRHEKAANILRGERHGLPFEMIDYSFITGSGKHQHHHKETVVRCRMGSAVPDFYLRPEHIFDKIGDFIGWHDIDFDHRPEFSKRYFLKGTNDLEIRRLFTDRVLTQLESEPENFCVDGHGDSLLVHRGRGYKFVEAEELEGYLDKCLAVVAAFRAR